MSVQGANFAGSEALPEGATCTVTVDVIGTGVGLLDNVSGELTTRVGTSIDLLSSGMASATLEVTAGTISLMKSFTDDPVAPSESVSLEFTINNSDRDFSATSITFSDDLDAALSGLVATGLPSAACGGTVSGTSTITFSGGSVNPESSCTFSVSLDVPAAAATGTYTNTTDQIKADINGTMVTGNAASEILSVQTAPRLTKTFLTNPVGAGDTVELEFTITNTSSTSAATDITFTDTFESVLPTASVVPADDFCGTGSTATFTQLIDLPGDGAIPANLVVSDANLGAGASCTFSITLDVLAGAAVGTYPNTTSEITATVGSGTVTGAPASDDLDIVAAPQLSKAFTDDPVQPGDTVTLQFTLIHDEFAPADATGIAFTDDLEAALSGLVATGLPSAACGGTVSGTSTISFSGGTLTPGETCTFSVSLQVPAAAGSGNYTNTISNVTATVSGLTVTGAPAEDDLQVADLTFSKSFTTDPVAAGGVVTLEFSLSNTSTTLDATSIFFTDNLGDAVGGTLLGLASSSGAQNDICGTGSSITGTTSLTFLGGNLLAGESCTFSVTLTVPAGAGVGTYNNATSLLFALIDGTEIFFNPATDTLTVADFSDTDGDGVLDDDDNCPAISNPSQTNTDGALDGGDACDSDDDNDGQSDADEIECGSDPLDDQSTSPDFDGDNIPDCVDPDGLESDGDGIRDSEDNCPNDANPDQADTDGDGLGDVCDPDDDNDGVLDGSDNCPLTANPGQENNDGDAQGDVCDPDDDNDGVLDVDDNCQFDANPGQEDIDEDGIGDVCDVACEIRTDYDEGGCTGTFNVDSLADLDTYAIDFGKGGGSNFQNVKIRVDLDNTGNILDIESPCKITLSDNVVLTADLVSLDGRKGVIDSGGYTINAQTACVLSEEDDAQMGAGSVVNADELTVQAEKTAKIGQNNILTITEALNVISTGEFASSDALIKSGSVVAAGSIDMSASHEVRFGQNSTITADTITLESTGDFGGSDALMNSGVSVTADTLTISASRQAKVGQNTTVTVSGDLIVESIGTASGSDANVNSGADVTVGGDMDLSGGNEAKIGQNSTVTVTGNLNMDAADLNKCDVKASATVTFATKSGVCAPDLP